MCASLILGTANHLGKKQIGEIWNDNADRVSALKFQAPRQAMRLVIQRFQGPLYSLREHLAHGTLFVDDRRYCSNGNPSQAGNIVNGVQERPPSKGKRLDSTIGPAQKSY